MQCSRKSHYGRRQYATLAALALANLCFDTLLSDGIKAKLAVEAGVSTKAVENIIEANTLLSGLGFESAGLAAATLSTTALPRWKSATTCTTVKKWHSAPSYS